MKLVCIVTALWLSRAVAMYKKLYIGGLFNQFLANGTAMDYAGTQQLAAFHLALDEINSHKNPNLLPGYRLVTSISNAVGFFGTIQASLKLTQNSFPNSTHGYYGIDAVVGSVPDLETEAANQMLQSDGLEKVQVSAYADDAQLSVGVNYPLKVRVCPSESLQAMGLQDVIYTHFEYRHVSMFATNEFFSAKSANDFQDGTFGVIEILSYHSVLAGTKDFSAEVAKAKSVGSLAFVVFMGAQEAVDLLVQGRRAGLFNDDTMIFMNSRCVNGSMVEELARRGSSVEYTAAQLFSNIVGLQYDPKFYLNRSPQGQQFLKSWRAQTPTLWPTKGPNGLRCNASTTDIDGDFLLYVNSKKTICAALDFSKFASDGSDIDQNVGLVYDATYTLAYGLHDVLFNKKKQKIIGADLHDSIIYNVNFTGVTGYIEFFDGLQPDGSITDGFYGLGDREAGHTYQIVSYFADSKRFESVGRWNVEYDYQLCDYEVNKTIEGPYLPCNRQLVYAGNGRRPADRYPNIIKEMIPAMRSLLLALGIIGILLTVFVAGALVFYRSKRLVKASQPMMMFLFLFGELVASLRTISGSLFPSTAVCTSHEWLGHMAFSLAFGALVLKTWRVHSIFNAKSLRRVKIKTFDILWRLGVIIAVFLVLLVLLTAVGQPVANNLELLSANRITEIYFCELKHNEFEFTFYALEALMLAYGAWLCYRTRGVPDAVNESKYISMAMGVIIFLCIIILPVNYAADLDEISQAFLAALGFGLSVISSILIIFGPKLMILLSGRDVDKDMKLQKSAQAKVYAAGADMDLYEAELAEYKELMDFCKRTLKMCKSSDEKYALAQAQAAWWRAQAMNVGEAASASASGSLFDASGKSAATSNKSAASSNRDSVILSPRYRMSKKSIEDRRSSYADAEMPDELKASIQAQTRARMGSVSHPPASYPMEVMEI